MQATSQGIKSNLALATGVVRAAYEAMDADHGQDRDIITVANTGPAWWLLRLPVGPWVRLLAPNGGRPAVFAALAASPDSGFYTFGDASTKLFPGRTTVSNVVTDAKDSTDWSMMDHAALNANATRALALEAMDVASCLRDSVRLNSLGIIVVAARVATARDAFAACSLAAPTPDEAAKIADLEVRLAGPLLSPPYRALLPTWNPAGPDVQYAIAQEARLMDGSAYGFPVVTATGSFVATPYLVRRVGVVEAEELPDEDGRSREPTSVVARLSPMSRRHVLGSPGYPAMGMTLDALVAAALTRPAIARLNRDELAASGAPASDPDAPVVADFNPFGT